MWLTRSGPESTTSMAERSSGPAPIRLDTLPGAGSGEPPRWPRESARSGPTEDRPPRSGDGRGQRDGGGSAGPSTADMRGHVAALAQENSELQALLSGRGEDPGTGEIVWPADGRILLRFGSLWGSRHAGLDIAVRSGTAVHAADWGKVLYSGRLGGYGKLVCVQHTQDLSTCYGQLSKIRVSEGDRVDSGEVLARSGCTGRCYADHLHFEVRENGRPQSPRQFLGPPLSAID